MRVSARYWPGQTSKEFIDIVRKWIGKARADDPSVDAEVNVYMDEPLHVPFELSPKEEIVEVLKRVTKHVLNREPKLTGHIWSSEAPYFQTLGIPCVCYGPGGTTGGHGGRDEHVKIEDVINCCKLFTAAILDVCT